MERVSIEVVDTLERLAKAATPGKRCVEDPLDQTLSIVLAGKETYEWWFLANCMMPDEDDHDFTAAEVKANAALIAATDPQTILALTAVVRALEPLAFRLSKAQAVPPATFVGTQLYVSGSEVTAILASLKALEHLK
jgi:hypothetical protein